MEVFLLLDQDTKPLKVFPLAGSEGSKPVEIVCPGGIPQDVERSFYRAGLAVYNLLMKDGGGIRNNSFICEMEDDTANRIYGGSGALAFAIASMCEMTGEECRKVIGATGVINTEKGTIERVEAINEKLSMVLERRPEVKTVFYPFHNDPEVVASLKRAAEERGVELKPVRTLQEVRKAVLSATQNPVKARRSAMQRPLFVLFFVISCFLYLFYGFSAHLIATQLLENEHYSVARWYLHVSRWTAFYNGELLKIMDDFNTPLEAEVVFIVRFATGREENYLIDRVPPVFRLCERDAFAFRVAPYEPLYMYIVQCDESGSFTKLYTSDNHLDIGLSSTSIPGTGVFFQSHGKMGNKDIYILLTKWRCTVLENVLSGCGQSFHCPVDLSGYHLEERSIQLKRLPVLLVN